MKTYSVRTAVSRLDCRDWPEAAAQPVRNSRSMNARRIHAEMREKFPNVDRAQLDWTNVVDETGRLRQEGALSVVVHRFESRGIQEVLVEVHRKLGDVMAIADLIDYLSEHHGKGEIRIADRAFSVFALLATNGVATSWATTAG